jgi:hypothetical protein
MRNTKPTPETIMKKLDKVKKALNDQGIRAWYVAEHNLEINSITDESVRTYGCGGHGDIADAIIEDGIRAGILANDSDK